MNERLEAALWYARNGYKVFPVNGKVPVVKNGSKDATTNEETIKGWWSKGQYGVAVATGSGLAVIDFDSLELNPWHSDLKAPRSTTPRGGHHYFYRTDLDVRNSTNAEKKVDVRGEGGYVVVEPSPGYRWNGALPPPASDLPLLPPEILERCKPAAQPLIKTNEGGLVPVGGRNDYMTRLAASMHNRGMTPEAILAALTVENDTKLAHPLSERELGNIVRSITRYTPSRPADQELKQSTSLVDVELGGGDVLHIKDVASQAVSYLKDKDKVKGQPTFFDGIDKMLGGGRRLGEVTCYHAEAKTGKNTLWHHMMYLMLEAGIPLGYASRELSPAEEVVPNLMSLAFKENAWLAEMTEERQEKYKAKMSEWPLYFSSGYGHFPADQIRTWITSAIALGVHYFFFDHLHYMLEDPEDHKAASKLIKEIKTMAKQLNIHIDIIIQPNKLMDGQRLSLNSIKGGAAMGQAIDNLFILERVKQEGQKSYVSKLTLEVARSKLCKPGSIFLQYNPETCMFGETEPEPEAPTEPVESDIKGLIANQGYNKLKYIT